MSWQASPSVHSPAILKRVRLRFVAAVVFLSPIFLSSQRLEAQDLQPEIQHFVEPGITVWVDEETVRGWGEDSNQALEKCKRGRSFKRYRVYYDYSESALTTSSRAGDFCYLHVFIVDPAGAKAGTSGTTRTWYQKYRLTAEGDFVDRFVDLKLSVTKGGVVETGILPLVAHQGFPDSALQNLPPNDETTITIKTNARDETKQIKFANKSRCCVIELMDAKITQWDRGLFNEPKLLINNPALLQPKGEGVFQSWFSLALEPRSSSAFWKSFSPYQPGKTPHTQLLLDLQFKVQGGNVKNKEEAPHLTQTVWVNFSPPWPLVVICVALGALLSTVLSIIIGLRQGALLFEPQKTTREKGLELLMRLFLSVVVALVAFLLYGFLFQGGTKVILFEYPLDPTQCPPAFLIGLIVGSRPDVYFKLLTTLKGPPGQNGATALLLAVAILGTVAPLTAQSSTPRKVEIRPIDLDYDSATHQLYILSSLSSSRGRVYRLEPPREALQEFARLDPDTTPTSQCLARWRGSLWLVSLVSRQLGSSGAWQVTLALKSVDRNQVISKRFLGFGQFHAVEFDAAHQRLLLTDRIRGGIYALPLGAEPLGNPVLLVSNAWLREPLAIVSRGDDLYVAVQGRHAVVHVNIQTGEVRPLVQDLSEPADVALTSDGSRLLVVDAGRSQVLEYDLRNRTKEAKELVGSTYLREPRAVQVDERGHLWVADAWLGAVLEFKPDEGRPFRQVP